MKLFPTIGIASVVLLAATSFLPWVYIAPIHTTLTGLSTPHTNYGSPAILSLILSALYLACILIPRLWAKRTGLFLAAFVVAWNLRNYLIMTRCEMGYCPEKKWGIYLILVFSLLILISACVPYLPPDAVKRLEEES